MTRGQRQWAGIKDNSLRLNAWRSLSSLAMARMRWRRKYGGAALQEALDSIPRMAARFRVSLDDREDLESVGLIGLAHAYRRFDPRKGVPFAAYASQRIRGVMLDELEKINRRARFEVQLDERIAA